MIRASSHRHFILLFTSKIFYLILIILIQKLFDLIPFHAPSRFYAYLHLFKFTLNVLRQFLFDFFIYLYNTYIYLLKAYNSLKQI